MQEKQSSDLQRRSLETKIALLADLSELLVTVRNSDDALQQICYLSRDLVGAEACCIWKLDLKNQEWYVAASFGVSPEIEKLRSRPDDRHVGELVNPDRTIFDKIIRLKDLEQDPLAAEFRENYIKEGFKSALAVPVRIEDQNSGLIVFYFKQPPEFDETQTRLGTLIANIAALVINGARIQNKIGSTD